MLLFGQYTTAQREEALADAERRRDVSDHTPTVELPVEQVKTMPALFQPREYIGADEENNRATLDDEHVKSLKRAIEIYGDIEPPLVIKLKGKSALTPRAPEGFVIVDGHHTLKAYERAKKTAIKCKWFPGTVREALDESMLRNGKDKLALRQAERMQEAWKRTLMGGWTVKQTALVCGVAEKSVKNMRRVVAAAQESKRGFWFRERLRKHTGLSKFDAEGNETAPLDMLKGVSWNVAWAIYRNTEVEEATKEEKAAGLSMALRNKMEHRLSEEPDVTAMALKLYDAKLPKLLMAQWAAMDIEADTDSIEEARRELKERNKAASDRAREAARTRARNEAEEKVKAAMNDITYAKGPEERLRAQEKLRQAHEAQVALEGKLKAQEALRAQNGKGDAPEAL